MNWIIKLPNTFKGNEMDFIKEFLLYSIKENKNKMLELKNRNEENIKWTIPNSHHTNLLLFKIKYYFLKINCLKNFSK